jgi:hypothetical protein
MQTMEGIEFLQRAGGEGDYGTKFIAWRSVAELLYDYGQQETSKRNSHGRRISLRVPGGLASRNISTSYDGPSLKADEDDLVGENNRLTHTLRVILQLVRTRYLIFCATALPHLSLVVAATMLWLDRKRSIPLSLRRPVFTWQFPRRCCCCIMRSLTGFPHPVAVAMTGFVCTSHDERSDGMGRLA